MDRIGMSLIRDKKATISASTSEDGQIHKSSVRGKDLLSLLLQANLADDVEPDQRLSDADVLAQIPTFLVAGMLDLTHDA